jgi:hypothetical protein
MKSISFNVPGMFDKVLSGEKTLTIRALYLPRFVDGDTVKLNERIGEWKKKQVGRTATARIRIVYPEIVGDITDGVARKEGFESAKESKEFLKKQYKLKDENWVFVIEWEYPLISKTIPRTVDDL